MRLSRLSRLFLGLALALPAPAVMAQADIAAAANYLCGTLTLDPAMEGRKDELCRCAAEAWAGNPPPAYVTFLPDYARFHEASGGDVTETNRAMAQQTGMTAGDVSAVASLMLSELGNDVLNCQ